jgi:hypothetical protein
MSNLLNGAFSGAQNLKGVLHLNCTGVMIGEEKKTVELQQSNSFSLVRIIIPWRSTIVDLLKRYEESSQAHRLVRMKMEFQTCCARLLPSEP